MYNVTWGTFCEIYGITPRNRILESFLEAQDADYSKEDIAEFTELDQMITNKEMSVLIKENILIPTRVLKGKQLYTLNKQSREVKIMLKAMDIILDEIAKEYQTKKISVL